LVSFLALESVDMSQMLVKSLKELCRKIVNEILKERPLFRKPFRAIFLTYFACRKGL